MARKKSRDRHPLYKPRMLWGVNAAGVSVVRIPEKSDPELKEKALNEARRLAGKYSNNNPLYW